MSKTFIYKTSYPSNTYKMAKAKVRYWELGRSNAKGEFLAEGTAEEINEKMLAEFGKHLMSKDISFDNGKISAGFHSVGNYSMVAITEEGK